MDIGTFALRFAIALLMGASIGVERQWRQRMAGTRTNALVAAGASAFVMSGILMRNSPEGAAGIIQYVVSGVGFLGAGVIFKDQMQVRGLNTAATIWCAAAVGVIAALGYHWFALIVVAGVLLTNTVLRPLAYRFIPRTKESEPEETKYHLEFVCGTADEARLRALLLQTVSRLPLTLYSLSSEDHVRGIFVDADLRMAGRGDEVAEQIVSRLSLEETVSSISWRLLPASGEHALGASDLDIEAEDES